MNVEVIKINIRKNIMIIEITPESRFKLDGVAISLRQMAIVKPNDLQHQFIKDNRLILSEEAILIVKKIRSKVKHKILAIDTYRKQLEKERKIQETLIGIKNKFGKNAILKGLNLQEGATAKDRNEQIGGHKA